MKVLVLFLVFFNTPLFSQDLSFKLDSTFANNNYIQDYRLKNTQRMDGEGWLIDTNNKLKHAFFSDHPWNSYNKAGKWEIENDSIYFFIKNEYLIKRYGYKSQESFKPFTLSWELNTGLKNTSDTTQRMIFKNQLTILNQSLSIVKLVNEIKIHLSKKLDQLKTNSNPSDQLFYFDLNKKIIDECTDYLYNKKLFSSKVITKKE